MPDLVLPPTSESDASAHTVAFLRALLRRRPGEGTLNRGSFVARDGTPLFRVTDVIADRLNEVRHEMQARNEAAGRAGGMTMYVHDQQTNAAPYFDAAWALVRRGVLRPAPVPQGADVSTVGTTFAVTSYGRAWLERAGDVLPADAGRQGQLLAAHGARLGAGYHARSQEAVACYHAQAYLACCVMCGAAAESITLALAVARAAAAGRNEASVLAEYRRTAGRSAIERLLTAGRNAHVQRELPTFLGLLNYWRDEAAHGAGPVVAEDEASLALLLLLKYAIFADTRWEELTAA
jgi:hypothetical protein